MSQAHAARMTAAEFLAWEAKQELKWEFDGFQPVAMNGGTVNHSTIQGNLIVSLRGRLRGGPCRPLGPDLRVATGAGRYRYPDAVVTCSPVLGETLEIGDPVVIFEVLSDGTARTDKTVKLIEYRSIPSLRRYAMLEQDDTIVTVVTRMELMWSIDVLGADDTLALPEIGIAIPVRELYADVELTLIGYAVA